MFSARNSGLTASLLAFAILTLVYRWLVCILLGKIFFSALGVDSESSTSTGITSALFLRETSFWHVSVLLGVVLLILAAVTGSVYYQNKGIVSQDSARLRAQILDAIRHDSHCPPSQKEGIFQKLEVVEAYRLNSEPSRSLNTIIVVLGGTLVIIFSWKCSLIAGGIILIHKAWSRGIEHPILCRLQNQGQQKQNAINAFLMDVLRLRNLVLLNQQTSKEKHVLAELEHAAMIVNRQIAQSEFWRNAVAQFLNGAIMPCTCIFTFLWIQQVGAAEAASESFVLLFVVFTLQELHRALSALTVIGVSKAAHDAAQTQIASFLATPSKSDDGTSEVGSGELRVTVDASSFSLAGNDEPLSEEAPSLALSDVTVRYTGAPEAVLSNVSVCFRAGMVHGITGESGRGKSTLLSLFSGLVRPCAGHVFIDSVHLDAVLSSYRSELAVVFQDSLLFARSIRENVCYGQQTPPTEEQTENALKMAGISEFVFSLPQGLETVLQSGELGLSGGQRQRLQLARLFMRNPRVVLMDEPSSGLDATTCKHVVASMKQFLAGRTAIIASHDRELVIEPLCHKVHDMHDICGSTAHTALLTTPAPV